MQTHDLQQRLLPRVHKPHVSGGPRHRPHRRRRHRLQPTAARRIIDTLVLATGFDLWDANFPAIEVIGREGSNLGKWWRDNKFQTYQGVSMPLLPELLNLASPYAFTGLSYFNTMECQMRHMDRLFGEVRRRGGRTFEVTEDANARLLRQISSSSATRCSSAATARRRGPTTSTAAGRRPCCVRPRPTVPSLKHLDSH